MAEPAASQTLLSRGTAIGTFLKIPRPEVVDLLATVGVDFVICDTEHGQVDEREARAVILAGRAAGLPVVVRVPSLDAGMVNRLLEAGACGIQLSGVRSRATAVRLSALTTYPPDGERGLSLAQPAARFGQLSTTEYLAAAKGSVLRVGQLESASYDHPLESVIEPLDVAFVGPMDLSVALGVPGDTSHPLVRDMATRVRQAAEQVGRAAGIFAATAPDALWAAEEGFRYIAVSSDLAWLRSAGSDAVAAARSASDGPIHG